MYNICLDTLYILFWGLISSFSPEHFAEPPAQLDANLQAPHLSRSISCHWLVAASWHIGANVKSISVPNLACRISHVPWLQ